MTLTGMMRSEWRDRKGSSKERFGWYVYDFADQSYGSVVVTLFGTLFLNIIAEQHAFTSGTTPSCNSSVVCTTDRTSYLAGAAQCTLMGGDGVSLLMPDACLTCIEGEGTMQWNGTTFGKTASGTVWFFGEVTPTAFASFVVSISSIVQVVVFITVGAWADYGTLRHRSLLVATVVACVSTMLFLVVGEPSAYWVAALLLIVSNVAYGVTVVFYNAYLPLLVDDHPDVVAAKAALTASKSDATEEAFHETREHVENTISGLGNGLGYLGGVIALVLSVVILMAALFAGASTSLQFRLVIFFAGCWWLLFGLWAIRSLQPRPGAPVPPPAQLATLGWRSTFATLSAASSYKNTFALIIVYFFYSDTYALSPPSPFFYSDTSARPSWTVHAQVLDDRVGGHPLRADAAVHGLARAHRCRLPCGLLRHGALQVWQRPTLDPAHTHVTQRRRWHARDTHSALYLPGVHAEPRRSPLGTLTLCVHARSAPSSTSTSTAAARSPPSG